MNLLDFDVVGQYWQVFLKGLGLTIFLTLVTMVLATALAIPLALGRLSQARLVRWPANVFVEFMRATPLILQLIYIYYVLPSAGIELDPLTAAITGLSLHYSAYLSEVFREDPVDPEGTVRGRLEPWAFTLAGVPQGYPAAGHTGGPTDGWKLSDLSLQGHLPGLRRHGPGTHVQRADHSRTKLPVLHHLHGNGDTLLCRVLSSGLAVRSLEDYTRRGRVAQDNKAKA